MTSLILLDETKTGDPALDPLLEEIAAEKNRRGTQYWIERLAPRAESIIDLTLDRLVGLKILQHHSGDFWTLAQAGWPTDHRNGSSNGTAAEFVKTRNSGVIFNDEIPTPRDIVIVCLVNTCDLFRFIFQLDEAAEERIELTCKMDLIGRAIAAAVTQNLSGPLLRSPTLSKPIPTVPLRKLLLNRYLRSGNLPAIFADLAKSYGPVFQIRPPFSKPMIFFAGPRTNRWTNRHGRMYLSAQDYLSDFEKVYGAHGILPAMDGADHFRFRKALAPAYSRQRLEAQLQQLLHHAREHMSDWNVGDTIQAGTMCRQLINAELSPLSLSVYSQDIIDDVVKFKERALCTHVLNIMPKFMLNTPAMKRYAKTIETLLDRVQSGHTPAQRAGCPRDLADDLLSLHTSDPQFLPASNLRFALSAPLIASVYLGDALNFAVYAMASQPALYQKIRAEADALFDNGDPVREDFTLSAIEVTHRFLMETMRLYPIVPMSVRTIVNPCVVEDYVIPLGSRVYIAQTASHYMGDVFTDPTTFDIDRYLPPREEHRGAGFAPYGLGTHTCLGSQWMQLQLAINLLMLAHYFTIEVSPADYKLRINPFPAQSPSKKLKYHLAAQRREIPA